MPSRPTLVPAPPVVQIAPGMTHDEELHRRLTTEQLLQSTDQNLAGIKRSLSGDEQEIIQQIRVYVQQSRAASGDGDITRAHTLALKAHLLSDDLVRR